MKQHGISLPRVSQGQARAGTKVDSISQARPGDLVAFGSPVHHIGIYVGDGKMIHAPRAGDVVKISKVHINLTAIRRVLPDAPALGSTPNVAKDGAATAIVQSAAQVANLAAGCGRFGCWHGDPRTLSAALPTRLLRPRR